MQDVILSTFSSLIPKGYTELNKTVYGQITPACCIVFFSNFHALHKSGEHTIGILINIDSFSNIQIKLYIYKHKLFFPYMNETIFIYNSDYTK